MEDMVRRPDVERTRFERKARGVREDHIPQAFCEADLDHLPRDVHPNHADSALLQRYRISARADPDLEDPFAVEFVHEDREDPRHCPGCEALRRKGAWRSSA